MIKILNTFCESKNLQLRQNFRFAAGGLRVEDFVPPAPGGNVSYRLWNLWSKEKPSSNIRMIVRSKVRMLDAGNGEIRLCLSFNVIHPGGGSGIHKFKIRKTSSKLFSIGLAINFDLPPP